MKLIIRLTVIMFLAVSCNGKQHESIVAEMAGIEEMIPETRQSLQEPQSPTPLDQPEKQETGKKKIIKDGRMGIKVKDLEKYKSRIDTLVKNNGGYFANESFQNNDQESSFILKIRVPSFSFEKFIASVESGEGEILFKTIEARDVTDQFIDLETRLDNKRNYLTRYRELVKQAKTVKEILDIEEKIRVLEEEIESTTGRLKYLGDLVDYSTLDLTLTRQKDFKFRSPQRDKFTERLKRSLSGGWTGLVDFTLGIINIWPFWTIVALVVFVWRRREKRKKKK